MRRQWFVPGLLVLAALAGYFSASTPVRAQGDAFPFQIGDTIILTVSDEGTRQCWVEDIKGMFARCGDLASRQGPTIGRREPPEEWVNVAAIRWVTKPRK